MHWAEKRIATRDKIYSSFLLTIPDCNDPFFDRAERSDTRPLLHVSSELPYKINHANTIFMQILHETDSFSPHFKWYPIKYFVCSKILFFVRDLAYCVLFCYFSENSQNLLLNNGTSTDRMYNILQ